MLNIKSSFAELLINPPHIHPHGVSATREYINTKKGFLLLALYRNWKIPIIQPNTTPPIIMPTKCQLRNNSGIIP